jgi:hypothetical protein
VAAVLARGPLIVFSSRAVGAASEEELSLFDSTGAPVAYIAIADDHTIYLWDGKPVAYLSPSGSDGWHVYGFAGDHLGWFEQGILCDHNGNAVGATKLPHVTAV